MTFSVPLALIHFVPLWPMVTMVVKFWLSNMCNIIYTHIDHHTAYYIAYDAASI